MTLSEQFKVETGSSLVFTDTDGNVNYSDEYVEWLENKLINNNIQTFSECTRVEVINHSTNKNVGIGRVFGNFEVTGAEIQIQDYGKTIKIFT